MKWLWYRLEHQLDTAIATYTPIPVLDENIWQRHSGYLPHFYPIGQEPKRSGSYVRLPDVISAMRERAEHGGEDLQEWEERRTFDGIFDLTTSRLHLHLKVAECDFAVVEKSV